MREKLLSVVDEKVFFHSYLLKHFHSLTSDKEIGFHNRQTWANQAMFHENELTEWLNIRDFVKELL